MHMQEAKSLADFVKEPAVSPTAEELLDSLTQGAGETTEHPEPLPILVVIQLCLGREPAKD